MAEQPTSSGELPEVRKGASLDESRYRLRSLFRVRAIPGWAVVCWGVADHLSRADFVFSKGGIVLRTVLSFISDRPLLQWLLGIGWLTAVVLWPKRLTLRRKQKTTERIQAAGSSGLSWPEIYQKLEPKIVIATPLDNEGVGLHAAVRGFVFPPDSSLQVLIYAGDGRWYLQPDVEVTGYVWSVRCQFGNKESKENSPYKLMAVHGDGLTERRYKTLPDGLIESNEVRVHRAAETKGSVVIVAPIQNEGVGHRHMVRGSVTPPGTPLQVLVGASDGPWILQGQVEVKDSTWSVECTFGNEEDKPGGSYNLIAVLGNELKDATYPDLADHLSTDTSALVTVQRLPPDKTQACPNRILHQIAESDLQQIGDRLKLIGVHCVTHFTDVLYVDFIFVVFNLALVQVSIDDAVGGEISFCKDRKYERVPLMRPPVMQKNQAKNCFFRGSHTFTIRQEVTQGEADFIAAQSKDSCCFFLGDLRITMHGDTISDVRFGTSFTVPKDDVLWSDHPVSLFDDIESRTEFHEKKLAELEEQHRDEIEKEKNRFDTIQALSVVYGAAMQLDEQLSNESSPSRAKHSIEVWQARLETALDSHLGVDGFVGFRDGSFEPLTVPDTSDEQRAWVRDQREKLSKLIENLVRDECPFRAKIVKVKSLSKQGADGGYPTALWERNQAHPTREVFIYDPAVVVEVATTLAVYKAIKDGKIAVVK